MEDFFQWEEEITFDGGILLLGAAAVQATKTHAQVTIHSVVKLWGGEKKKSDLRKSYPLFLN